MCKTLALSLLQSANNVPHLPCLCKFYSTLFTESDFLPQPPLEQLKQRVHDTMLAMGPQCFRLQGSCSVMRDMSHMDSFTLHFLPIHPALIVYPKKWKAKPSFFALPGIVCFFTGVGGYTEFHM